LIFVINIIASDCLETHPPKWPIVCQTNHLLSQMIVGLGSKKYLASKNSASAMFVGVLGDFVVWPLVSIKSNRAQNCSSDSPAWIL